MRRANTRGFIALTAVILLAAGTLAFSISTVASAVLYADAVMKRELRIQARLNVQACLDSVELMLWKDHFLNGEVHLRDFGCTAQITRSDPSHAAISATATLSSVAARDSRAIQMPIF